MHSCLKSMAITGMILLMQQSILMAQNTQQPGTWKNVTPPDMKMGEYGLTSVRIDPVKPSDAWCFVDKANCVWKSTDYGVTWAHCNTGTNSDKTNSGSPWYTALDPNPNRNPATPPTMYMTQGYASLGLWKSTDGGVGWTQTWNNNIYALDGVTNISADVGSDIHSIHTLDPANPLHCAVTLHGYSGTGNNNGIFESIDGGAKWVAKKTKTFAFQNHSDLFFPFDGSTWMVWHGQPYPTNELYRTTDAGVSWTQITSADREFGRHFLNLGSVAYASSDGGLWRSSDKGLTWKKVLSANLTTVMATGKYLYAFSGAVWDKPIIRRALKSNDTAWTLMPTPDSMNGGSDNDYGSTFDGTNHILLKAARTSGLWRYVEPSTSTIIKEHAIQTHRIVGSTGSKIMVTQLTSSKTNGTVFTITGKAVGKSNKARQAVLLGTGK